MAKKRYSPGRLAAIGIGVILIGLDARGAYEYALKAEAGSVSYLVLAAPIIALTAGLLPILVGNAFKSRQHLKAIFLFVAFLFAGAVVFLAALERTAASHQTAAQARLTHNARVADAKAELAKAIERRDVVEVRKLQECASGRGARCKALREEAEAAADAVTKATAAVTAVGAAIPSASPKAVALAAYMPGVSAETIDLYQPMVLPMALLVVGLATLHYGASSDRRRRRRKTQVVKVKPKKKAPRKRKPKPAAIQIPSGGNVIPFPR